MTTEPLTFFFFSVAMVLPSLVRLELMCQLEHKSSQKRPPQNGRNRQVCFNTENESGDFY
jgi:hypothetical protein